MPKINQEEYEVLKDLDGKWEWIARDEDGELYVYTTTPHKGSVYWSNEDLMFVGIDDNLFQFIQWEDQEPYNIAELIEEYEIKELRLAPSGTVIVDSFDESEETEVKKDIEWLKEEVNEIKKLISDAWGAAIIAGNQHFEIKNSSEMQIVKRISDLIDQLDEPEVTLDKAFEKVAESYSMTKEEVWRQLESFETRTEVLSQGLPTIPKFVAEHIEKWKNSNVSLSYALSTLRDELTHFRGSDEQTKMWLYHSVDGVENQELYARAWLDGFKVEEEQKYIVVTPHRLNNAFDLYLCETDEAVCFLDKEDEFNDRVKYKFTEEEIKNINPDYMTFAIPVEELEE